nr:hypothetical protein [Vibrio cincinnatiensis]
MVVCGGIGIVCLTP